MSIVHASTFPAEALDMVKAAAEAATAVEGVVGYRILGGQDKIILHLEVANHATFDKIGEHPEASKASAELWAAYPPQGHDFLHTIN